MKTLLHYFFASLLAVSILAAHASGTSNGIDPSDADEQYAWSEGVGWINFEVTSLVGSPDEVILSDTSMV